MNAGAPVVAERYLTRALALRPGWPEALQALAQIRATIPDDSPLAGDGRFANRPYFVKPQMASCGGSATAA